jgi:fructose-bisphosphate aldolase class II
MIVPTSNLFKLAYGKYAIGAYNINNMEQTLGLFKGSIESQAPFIIQLSKGARKYADKGMLEVIIRKAEEIFAACLPCTSTMATRPPVTIALNRAFTVR